MLAAAVLAAAAARADERFAFATLENGASIGFALVRTGEAGPSEAMGEAALPRSNSVSRVLWDRESGAYFGYRVEVERKDGPRPFRVSFKPLDRPAVERELKQRGRLPRLPPARAARGGPALPGAAASRRGRGPHPRAPREPGDRRADPRRRPALGAAGHPRGHARGGGAGARGAAGGAPRRGPRRARPLRRRRRGVQARRSRCSRTTPSVHNKLGICYQQLKDDTEARREYDRALALDPGYAEVWNNIGTLEQARKRFKPAVRAYKKAIETKPGLATPWKNLGNAYLVPRTRCRRPSRPTRRPSASTRRSSRARGRASPPPASTPPPRASTSPSSSPRTARRTRRSSSCAARRRRASATSRASRPTRTSSAVVADPRYKELAPK